jgi:hypothetical protein
MRGRLCHCLAHAQFSRAAERNSTSLSSSTESGPDVNLSRGKAAVEIALPHDWLPIVDENLDRPPIGNPAEEKQAFLDQAPKGLLEEALG